MKPRCSERRNQALTLVEVLAIIAIVILLIAITLTRLATPEHSDRIRCVNNLKETGLAFKIWAGDHGDKYPMDVSVTNGGTMEIFSQGSPFQSQVFHLNYLVMSNELNTPRLLYCPADTNGFMATDFVRGFNNQNVSYFVGVDANETNPQMMLLGDDNFEIGGVPVESGLLQISTNTPIAWSAARHGRAGNVAFTDGSVQQLTTSGLQQVFQNAGTATNRIAIP